MFEAAHFADQLNHFAERIKVRVLADILPFVGLVCQYHRQQCRSHGCDHLVQGAVQEGRLLLVFAKKLLQVLKADLEGLDIGNDLADAQQHIVFVHKESQL